jgi:hypothetical protein
MCEQLDRIVIGVGACVLCLIIVLIVLMVRRRRDTGGDNVVAGTRLAPGADVSRSRLCDGVMRMICLHFSHL